MQVVMKKSSLIVGALVGLLGLAKASSAATITFTTTLLSSPNNLITLGNGISVSYAPASLSYDTSLPPASLSPFDVDYGTFTVNVAAGSDNVSITNQPYQIQLSVTSPGSTTATVVGDITGVFKKINVHVGDEDTIQFLFTPNPATTNAITFNEAGIGTITWDFDSTNIGGSGAGPYTGDMLGSVAYTTIPGGGPTVPLPASLLSGTALLGGIALAKARSRKNAV